MTSTPIRPELLSVLGSLRRRIRTYVFLEGVALVTALLAALFWFSFALNLFYFWASNLELPRGVRLGVVVIAVALTVTALVSFLLLRLLKSMRTKALSLVLERRFPELDDRLITAVEAAENPTVRETELSRAMMSRTVEDVVRMTQGLNLGSVFEKKPLRRATLAATFLLVSIGVLFVANQRALGDWWSAFISLDDEYWERETELLVRVLSQPGDRIRMFDQNLEYHHPREGELTLLIVIPKQNRHGREMIDPGKVDLRTRLANGASSGRISCTRLQDSQLEQQLRAAAIYKYSVSGLASDMDIWVRGGDFANRDPYKVRLVDPPRVDRIHLECDYPAYTGMNEFESLRQRDVLGHQISIPMETRFVLRGTANKPLLGVRLVFGRTEFSLGYFLRPDSPSIAANSLLPGSNERDERQLLARLTHRGEDGSVLRTEELSGSQAAAMFSSGSNSFAIPFLVSERLNPATQQRANQPFEPFGTPLVMAPNTDVRIYFEDEDEVNSLNPEELTINGSKDIRPSVKTNLRGVSSSITRKARIPVVGLLTDDYGIVQGRFDYRIGEADAGGDDKWRPRPFQVSPRSNPKEFRLQRAENETLEIFDVLPLGMEPGQSLTLSVYAEDGDNLNGPNISRNPEPFKFKIVTEEELLSILYERELALRMRFEDAVKELEETRKTLVAHRQMAEEAEKMAGQTPPAGKEAEHQKKLKDLLDSVRVTADRTLIQVRKNNNESRGIEESFSEILDELVNNGINTKNMIERVRELIIQPLHRINTVDFDNADKAISLYKLAVDRQQSPVANIDQSVVALDQVISGMKRVLAEMQDLVKFHQAVKQLEDIIKKEQKLAEETEKKRKQSVLDRLKGLDLE